MSPSWLILASSCAKASSKAWAILLFKAASTSDEKHVLSPPHQQQTQLDRQQPQHLGEVSFKNWLKPVGGLPIPNRDIRHCDYYQNGRRCSPSLSQHCFSLFTECSTSDRDKFCGANETTVHRLRGAGRKNCRLTTFHVP